MSAITPEAAQGLLEDRLTKIAKQFAAVAKEAPKMAPALDDEALIKINAFLQARTADLLREMKLAQVTAPARIKFSLDRPPEQSIHALELAPNMQSVAQTPPTAAAPTPARPQRPAWRKPVGRLAGTKEPVYGEHDSFDPATAASERPDPSNGYIAEAGFIDE